MKNEKESLSIIIVKTLLAVIIFTGMGTIIIGGAKLIVKNHKSEVDLKYQCETDDDCVLVFANKGCCVFVAVILTCLNNSIIFVIPAEAGIQ